MSKTNVAEQESWLVLRAQAGDTAAFDELLSTVQLPLFRYVLSVVRDEALAQDTLQEVFLRIYRKLGWLREPQLFRTWAYRIATNEAYRQLKRQRLWSEQVRDEETLMALPAAPSHSELANEWTEQLPYLITALSPASRAVIVLYYLQELSLEEVANVLDIPIGTVKSRLAYGLNQLRKMQPLQ